MHIVLFKSSGDVMQVSTLSAQLGLGSKLVDCYRDATPVPHGQLLIDLSSRTDDRFRYCIKNRTHSINVSYPGPTEQSIFSNDEYTKSLHTASTPIIFPQMEKSFPSVLFKRVYQVLLRMHSKSSQRKPARHKKTSRDKTSKPSSVAFSKTNHFEARDLLACEKRLQLIKIITSAVINHLF